MLYRLENPYLSLGYLAALAFFLSVVAYWAAGFGKIQTELVMPRFYSKPVAVSESSRYVSERDILPISPYKQNTRTKIVAEK